MRHPLCRITPGPSAGPAAGATRAPSSRGAGRMNVIRLATVRLAAAVRLAATAPFAVVAVLALGVPASAAATIPLSAASQDATAPAPAGDAYLDASRGSPPAVEDPPSLSTARRAEADRAVMSLTTTKDAVRAKAEKEILGLGRGAIPALVAGAATSHEGRQGSIARCLLQLVDDRDRRLVEDALQSEHVALRRFAAAAAGRIGTVRLIEALPARLTDEDAEVRLEAALSLVDHGREDGLPLLVQAFDDTTRERILPRLAGLADGSRQDALRARLTIDEQRMRLEPEVANAERRAAVAMLAAIGDKQAIHGLSIALDDPNSLVQLDAIDALRRLVEDAEPFGASSIFAQIKEVERLKGVLQSRR